MTRKEHPTVTTKFIQKIRKSGKGKKGKGIVHELTR